MSRNNVSVTLSGRDQLSGVVNQANRSLTSLANVGRIALGVGLVTSIAATAKSIRRMAGDFDGPLRQSIESAERSLRAFNVALVEVIVGEGDLNRANELLVQGLAALLAVTMGVRQNIDKAIAGLKLFGVAIGIAVLVPLTKVIVTKKLLIGLVTGLYRAFITIVGLGPRLSALFTSITSLFRTIVGFGRPLGSLFKSIKNSIFAAIDAFKNFRLMGLGVFQALIRTARFFVLQISQAFQRFAVTANTVFTFIKARWRVVVAGLVAIFEPFFAFVTRAFKRIFDFIGRVTNFIRTKTGAAVGFIATQFETLRATSDSFEDNFATALSRINDIMAELGGTTDTTTQSMGNFTRAVRTLIGAGLATRDMLSELVTQATEFNRIALDTTKDIFTRAAAIESAAEIREALTEAFRIDPASLPTMRTIIPRQALDIQPLTGEVKANFQAAVRTFQFDAMAIIEDMTSTIGDALFDGFAAAFSAAKGERISSLFKELGATLLDGLGRIFSEMGKQLIGFGKIMEALRPALLNVFTAGPAAIAAGAALVALGGTLSGIAMRSRGTAAPSTSQLPSSRFQFRELEGEGKIIIQGGILDMSDPRQANALSRAISQLSGRRRITLQGA